MMAKMPGRYGWWGQQDWCRGKGSQRSAEKREDRALLAEATARMGRDNGVRHSLDDVAREFGIDLDVNL